jgi:hypothetical protein
MRGPIEQWLEMYADELLTDESNWLNVLATPDGVAVITAATAPSFADACAGIDDPDEHIRRRRELRAAWVRDSVVMSRSKAPEKAARILARSTWLDSAQ